MVGMWKGYGSVFCNYPINRDLHLQSAESPCYANPSLEHFSACSRDYCGTNTKVWRHVIATMERLDRSVSGTAGGVDTLSANDDVNTQSTISQSL